MDLLAAFSRRLMSGSFEVNGTANRVACGSSPQVKGDE